MFINKKYFIYFFSNKWNESKLERLFFILHAGLFSKIINFEIE